MRVHVFLHLIQDDFSVGSSIVGQEKILHLQTRPPLDVEITYLPSGIHFIFGSQSKIRLRDFRALSVKLQRASRLYRFDMMPVL